MDIYAPKNTKYLSDLQQLFADSILRLDELDESAGDDRIYELDAVADRDFELTTSVDSGIQSVALKRLRL